MKNEIEEGGHPQLIGENDVAERERERERPSQDSRKSKVFLKRPSEQIPSPVHMENI
jgi:hypothetical protein